MTTFPGSPKLTKGAIIGFDLFNPLASVIIFQYNPKSLSRQLQARTADQGAAQNETLRLAGPPTETITISELELDHGHLSPTLGIGDVALSQECGGDRQHCAVGRWHHRGDPAGGAIDPLHLGNQTCLAGAHHWLYGQRSPI